MGRGANSVMQHDLDADEWHYTCTACNKQLFAPTKQHLLGSFIKHTRSTQCLGGW